MVVLAAVVFMASGCAVPFHKKLDTHIAAAEYAEAESLIEKEKKAGSMGVYGPKNELLYLFDRGAVLQMEGNYGKSVTYFNTAEELIDKLYTKSVLNEAGSFLSNDLALNYDGEDFEHVMVHVLKALNFMYEGNFRGAGVEARKVNHKINVIADTMGKNAVYTDDPLARYISALAYEALGENESARIDYKKSAEAYEKHASVYKLDTPLRVKEDALRLAAAVGHTGDVLMMRKKWGEINPEPHRNIAQSGEVILVVYDGLPAYKKDERKWPKFVKRGVVVQSAHLSDDTGKSAASFVAHDISALAVKNLEAKNAQIMMKKIGSTIVKQMAKNVPGLNLFVGEDKADTRSWRTLPARFHIARLAAAPGKRVITAEIKNTRTGAVDKYEFEVSLKRGEKKVIPVFKMM